MGFTSKHTGAQIEAYLDSVPNKQDKISDLESIRSGAAKGASAIQEVKTINGQSIVGSGDITIEAGGGTSSLEKVVAAGLTDLDTRIKKLVSEDTVIKADIKALQDDSQTRATKAEVKESDDNITAEMTSNERVTAAALIDLQTKLQNIITRLEALENK